VLKCAGGWLVYWTRRVYPFVERLGADANKVAALLFRYFFCLGGRSCLVIVLNACSFREYHRLLLIIYDSPFCTFSFFVPIVTATVPLFLVMSLEQVGTLNPESVCADLFAKRRFSTSLARRLW
jgi:hypothetical protein